MPTKPTPFKSKQSTNKKWGTTGFDYNQPRWVKESAQFKRDNPLCWMCKEEGRTEPATITDHNIPIPLCDPWDRTNWRPLCTPHHNSKSRKEQNR